MPREYGDTNNRIKAKYTPVLSFYGTQDSEAMFKVLDWQHECGCGFEL